MPARSARSACSALPPLHPPSIMAPMDPCLHGPMTPGTMTPTISMLQRPTPLLCGSWPHGRWPYASRPNQMTLKAPVHAPPLRPLRLLPFRRSSAALHGPNASMAPWLPAPWPPMSPLCLDGQPPTFCGSWPHGPMVP